MQNFNFKRQLNAYLSNHLANSVGVEQPPQKKFRSDSESECVLCRLARDIHETLGVESVVLLCVLKGGFQFTQDLMNTLNAMNRTSGRSIQFNLDFLRLKSNYTNEELGKVKVIWANFLVLPLENGF